MARSHYLPEIDLEAHAGYEPLDERPAGGGATMDGMLFATWELFKGFETQKGLAAANAKKRVAEAKLKGAIINALADVEQTYRRIIAIQERVELEAKNRRLSIRLYAAVISEYKRGVKNSGDVKSAADSVLEAHTVESQYKFDFLKEKLNLGRVLGGEIITENMTHEHYR